MKAYTLMLEKYGLDTAIFAPVTASLCGEVQKSYSEVADDDYEWKSILESLGESPEKVQSSPPSETTAHKQLPGVHQDGDETSVPVDRKVDPPSYENLPWDVHCDDDGSDEFDDLMNDDDAEEDPWEIKGRSWC